MSSVMVSCHGASVMVSEVRVPVSWYHGVRGQGVWQGQRDSQSNPRDRDRLYAEIPTHDNYCHPVQSNQQDQQFPFTVASTTGLAGPYGHKLHNNFKLIFNTNFEPDFGIVIKCPQTPDKSHYLSQDDHT